MNPLPEAMTPRAGVLETLRQGLRALLLLPVRWPRVRGGIVLTLLLGLLLVLSALALDRYGLLLEQTPGASVVVRLDATALRLLLGELALVALLAGLAARHAPWSLVQVALALLWWHLLASHALWLTLRPHLHGLLLSLLMLALMAWWLLALWLLLRRGFGGQRLKSWQAAGLVLPLALWSLTDLLRPGPRLWEAVDVGPAAETLADEPVFDLQQELLARQAATLLPQRPDLSEYYFISFAPDGSEAVFPRELDVIHPLLERRLETEGRALRLQNAPRGLRQYPVATAGNLRRAIAAMAARMDRERDVLLLYLTAHGSPGHQLSAQLDPLQLEGLKGEHLRQMLDASGIRHRVVIVSACYSGGFIDRLADPHTLVITASDAYNPSFGCGNESDFTWFGRAFFEHGIARTVSLTQAYGLALPVIRRWETEQRQGYSNPQMSLGQQIAPLLQAIDQRLAARAAAQR